MNDDSGCGLILVIGLIFAGFLAFSGDGMDEEFNMLFILMLLIVPMYIVVVGENKKKKNKKGKKKKNDDDK